MPEHIIFLVYEHQIRCQNAGTSHFLCGGPGKQRFLELGMFAWQKVVSLLCITLQNSPASLKKTTAVHRTPRSGAKTRPKASGPPAPLPEYLGASLRGPLFHLKFNLVAPGSGFVAHDDPCAT